MKNYLAQLTKVAVIVSLAGGTGLVRSEPAAPSLNPAAALEKLKTGNAHFASSTESSGKPTRARRLETAQGQHPFAIIVGCSDSRTPPEIVFDQNIGDLFVVRTAGEVVGDYELGSIEYAVEHLGAHLIVVLGHARCGAVDAALASDTAPGHVGSIVKAIRQADEAVRGKPGDELTNAIKQNVERVATEIESKAKLGSLAASVKIVPAYYDFETGKIEWMNR